MTSQVNDRKRGVQDGAAQRDTARVRKRPISALLDAAADRAVWHEHAAAEAFHQIGGLGCRRALAAAPAAGRCASRAWTCW